MQDTMRLQIIDGKHIYSDNELRVGKRIHGRGTVTRDFNHPDEYVAPDKSMCRGCYEDFYNGEGAKECWSFKKAVVCNKVGYSSIHCANGPDTIMKNTLSCWHAVSK